ncbi:hypothetical protein [Ferruginibacter sp. SUN106]|uniref:hypothetical protein n=1 Tax=Ferruginibacter sp. SUN106 TaxID=2978348 RepID=UPI003D3606B7
MMKNIIYLLILLFSFTETVNAQKTIEQVEAINNANGTKQINITDVSGKVTTITAGNDAALKAKYLNFITQQAAQSKQVAAEQKPQIVSHRAVIGTNSKQQIIVTFSTGKEVAIDAIEGQTIQETYLAYLKKEGLACGCSPVAAPANTESNIHTATKNATQNNQ